MEILDFALWSAGAVIVVGVLQWLKGMFTKVNKVVWSLLLPVVAFGVAISIAVKEKDYSAIIWNASGIWAIAQIGYELIIQTIKKRLG